MGEIDTFASAVLCCVRSTPWLLVGSLWQQLGGFRSDSSTVPQEMFFTRGDSSNVYFLTRVGSERLSSCLFEFCVTFYMDQVRVGNLPPKWSGGWETRYFKVIFYAEEELGETCQEQLGSNGCIEWAEPLKIWMRGGPECLVASLLSSTYSDGGVWSFVPGCEFEGFTSDFGHSVWRHEPVRPGAGPNTWAELNTVAVEDESTDEHFETVLKATDSPFFGLEQYFPAPAPARASPSVFPGTEMDVGPAQERGGSGQELQETGAPTEQPCSSKRSTSDSYNSLVHRAGRSSGTYPTGTRRLASLFGRRLFQVNPSSTVQDGPTQELRSGWKWSTRGSARGQAALVSSEGKWKAVHSPPPPLHPMQFKNSANSSRTASYNASIGGSERNAVPQPKRSTRPFQFGTGIRRRSRVVIPSHTGPRQTTGTASMESTSHEELYGSYLPPPTSSEVLSRQHRLRSTVPASYLEPPKVGVDRSVFSTRRSRAAFSTRRFLAAHPTRHSVTAFSTRLPIAEDTESPSLYYDKGGVRVPPGSCESVAASARLRAQSNGSVLALEDQSCSYNDYDDGVQPLSADYGTELASADTLTMLENDTRSVSTQGLNTSNVPFNTERVMPQGGGMSVGTRRAKSSASRIATVARNPSPESLEVAVRPETRTLPADNLRVLPYGCRQDRQPSLEDYETELVPAQKSKVLGYDTAFTSTHELDTSELHFNTRDLTPRGQVSSAPAWMKLSSVSQTAASTRNPLREAVEFISLSETCLSLAEVVQTAPRRWPISTAQRFEALANMEAADLVQFTCFLPRSVCGGRAFELRVSACSGRIEDYTSRATSREEAVEVDMLGAMRIARGTRVTMKLELPENAFNVLDRNGAGSNDLAANDPPSVLDFLWDGVEQQDAFRVTCLPDVVPGAVRCGLRVDEGSRATRLPFGIDVVEDNHTSAPGDPSAVEELGEIRDGVEDNKAEDDPSEPTVCDTERGIAHQQLGPAGGENMAGQRVLTRPSKVYPPAPFRLASRVDPGASVHESKEHGFRLTVQNGSLRSPIGPITVQEFAQVVRCEDNGQDYLVKAVVDCRPSGATFPDKPLLMDFRIEENSSTDISGVEQVVVRKGGAGGWKIIKSEVRVDRWGTYLRADVSHFCLFARGTKVNPGDPARLESCDKKDMIEVQNATEEEIYFVLVPVSFDSDKTSRVTYTGNIGFGVAGILVEAAGGLGYESAIKSHMLPAGFTPDDISVAAGGKFQFTPPPGASQGKLLVATITENSQLELSVKVLVLHGKFNTPKGRRRVILPICLKSKSRISARLGPNDIPVNMVMIMAGMGSRTTSTTEALSPGSSTPSAAPSSRVVSPALPPHSAQRRGGTTPSCGIS